MSNYDFNLFLSHYVFSAYENQGVQIDINFVVLKVSAATKKNSYTSFE